MWWFALLAYSFEILCIFMFIVYCTVTFLMVMCNTETEELRKCIVFHNRSPIAPAEAESHESVDDKLEVLTEKLTEKEHALQQSHCEIQNAEKVLNDLEKNTSTCRDRYRSLMVELKKDVRKTEDEEQISSLSVRRQALKHEVLQQQENYQKMLNKFTKELENKKTLFSTGTKKPSHPRVSCFPLV
ncbi:uncharacterized protein LOC143375131 [Andrena cerasifolii]|uniref:uncharacterized protein LOC143375131 n=1 Tax=Andrena cerasifolii TaxID=2819439 RepID=UPI00403798C7